MENTKGYLRLKGIVWALDKKEAWENDSIRTLSFGLKTSKDNSLFLQVGEWKNTALNVKIKGEGSTEVEEINEQDAIDKIKKVFKDGDSVFVNARVQVDTYRKKINYIVNQMYIEKEPIDFENTDFEETNELTQTVIVTEKSNKRSVKVGLTTYKGEMIEQELKLNDDDVNDYFEENARVGDVMKLTISVNRKPNYLEDTVVSERKTLKGKAVQSSKRTIDKENPYIEFLEVIDVDLEKTEKQKYDKKEIREALELVENRVIKQKDSSSTSISEEELPF